MIETSTQKSQTVGTTLHLVIGFGDVPLVHVSMRSQQRLMKLEAGTDNYRTGRHRAVVVNTRLPSQMPQCLKQIKLARNRVGFRSVLHHRRVRGTKLGSVIGKSGIVRSEANPKI